MLYLVIKWVPCEGYDTFYGVYSTEEAATLRQKTVSITNDYPIDDDASRERSDTRICIVKLELDKDYNI